MSKPLGKIYLVGAGPGDPGLLTLRGKKILESAGVVFYDYLVQRALLKWCPGAETHYVGKIGYGDSVAQEKIQNSLLEAVKHHPIVVRLKGGDPFLFGRGGEEAEFLHEAGIPFEIIPGVTSAIAVPAYGGIPLTHRDYSSFVTIVTGHQEDDALDWKALAAAQTLVFLMGVKNLKKNFCSIN